MGGLLIDNFPKCASVRCTGRKPTKKRPWQKLFRHRFVAIVHAVSSARSARTLHRHKQKTNFTTTLPHCAVVLFLACLAEGEEGLPLQSLKKEVENGKPKKGNAKWEA
jgi:hypothetical protein